MTLRTRLALWFLPITLALVLIPWWLTRPQGGLDVSSLKPEVSGAAFSTPSSESERDRATSSAAQAPAANREVRPSTPPATPRPTTPSTPAPSTPIPDAVAPPVQAAPAERREAQSSGSSTQPAPQAVPTPITPEAPPALVNPSPQTPNSGVQGASAPKPSAPARAAPPVPDAKSANAPSNAAGNNATTDTLATTRDETSALQQQLEGLKNRQEPVLLRFQAGQLEVLEHPSSAPSSPSWLWAGVLLTGAWLAGAWGIRRSLGPLYALAGEIARRGPTRLDALEPPPLPELRPAVTALNKLLEELREKLARLELQEQSAKRFAYNASHELRNPLTAARNYLEILTRHPNEREAGVQALEAVRRTEKVLGSLLTLARLEGRGRVRGEGVDLRSFLEANFELPVLGDGTVWAERDLLELAIENIVKNADEHASGVRRARIETTPSGVWLWLEDDGPGFAPEVIGHAFEPFVHGGSGKGGSGKGGSSTGSANTGLGLAIVEAVARAHGGEARAENLSAGGARVGLRLPSGAA